jgi:cysteine synthase A
VAYTTEQQERRLQRHRYDTIAEGIGLDRITQNFAIGLNLNILDDAVKVTDQEAVDMAHWLLRNEGLFCGSSSAMNVSAAIQYASTMPPDSCVVTIICDSGQRHLSRFWNRDFIIQWGLYWPGDDMSAWHDRLNRTLGKRRDKL